MLLRGYGVPLAGAAAAVGVRISRRVGAKYRGGIKQERLRGTIMNKSDWPEYVQKRDALEGIQLRTATDGITSLTAAKALEWLYGVLTTLDSKASALMRLNGVLIAAAAFLLGRPSGAMLSVSSADSRIVALSALLSAASICCCLFVVNVSWPFLGKVNTSAAATADCKTELQDLGRACKFRERAYRTAWWISLLASAAFLLEFLNLTWKALCP